MAQSEEQLKRAADLKLWIESRIGDLQEEIDRLREALAMTDAVLRASSFRPAIEVKERGGEGGLRDSAPVAASSSSSSSSTTIPEKREIRRDRSSEVIANAEVVGRTLIVEPVSGVGLRTETPPFKSFLIGKILEGAKTRDEELVSKGKLRKGDEIRFNVEDKDGRIQRVTIENYGDKERLSEIINTISWTFSRMLEKK
jgi:hypothetical protein